MAQWLKNPPTMQETQVQSLGWEDTLEKKMVTHSSNLPGKSCEQRSLVGYNPRGCKRIRHNLATKQQQSQPIRRQSPLKRQILLKVLKKGRKVMPWEGHLGKLSGSIRRQRRGETWTRTFSVVSVVQKRKDKIYRLRKEFQQTLGYVTASSFLVPGPEMFRAGGQ